MRVHNVPHHCQTYARPLYVSFSSRRASYELAEYLLPLLQRNPHTAIAYMDRDASVLNAPLHPHRRVMRILQRVVDEIAQRDAERLGVRLKAAIAVALQLDPPARRDLLFELRSYMPSQFR